MKRISIALIAVTVLFAFTFCFVVFASDLDDVDSNTGVSKWAYSSQPGHMGTKNLSYSFSEPNLYYIFNANVIDGSALWGTNINMSYTSDTTAAGLIFEVMELPDPAISSTTLAGTLVDTYNSTTGHRTKCHIYLNTFFVLLDDDVKETVIAHELGHAYGLGQMNCQVKCNKF